MLIFDVLAHPKPCLRLSRLAAFCFMFVVVVVGVVVAAMAKRRHPLIHAWPPVKHIYCFVVFSVYASF